MTKQAYTIAQFCAAYGISKSFTYKLIAAGKLQTVKVGRRTLVTGESVQEWWGLCTSQCTRRAGPQRTVVDSSGRITK